MQRICLVYIIWFFQVSVVLSQGYPVPVNHYLDQHSINPAFAGENKHLTSTLYYKQHWMGFPGAPVTGFFSLHTPVNNTNALGALVVFDQLAIRNNNKYYLDYVYRIHFSQAQLALGLRVGIEQVSFDWASIESVDHTDPVFSSPVETYSMPNVGFGALYRNQRYYVGFSIPEFLSYQQDYYLASASVQNDYQYYQFIVSSGLTYSSANVLITPSTMMWYSINYGFHADVVMKVDFTQFFALGMGYRLHQSMLFFMEYPLSKQLRIAYAFDYNTTKLSHYSYGSHELMLNFQFIYSEQSVSPRF